MEVSDPLSPSPPQSSVAHRQTHPDAQADRLAPARSEGTEGGRSPFLKIASPSARTHNTLLYTTRKRAGEASFSFAARNDSSWWRRRHVVMTSFCAARSVDVFFSSARAQSHLLPPPPPSVLYREQCDRGLEPGLFVPMIVFGRKGAGRTEAG